MANLSLVAALMNQHIRAENVDLTEQLSLANRRIRAQGVTIMQLQAQLARALHRVSEVEFDYRLQVDLTEVAYADAHNLEEQLRNDGWIPARRVRRRLSFGETIDLTSDSDLEE